MKACPKCQEKNHESNNFCKKCGFKIPGSQFQAKKEKILGEKKKSSWVMISFVIAATALGGIAYWIIQGRTPANSRVLAQPKVSGIVDYAGQNISMTDVQTSVENGKISIPLDLVLQKRMVRFEYEANGNKLPLLAYITQTGKVVTAVSLCEPCRSTRFHIEGKTIVCNACATQWNLETLKGISGGCLNYPPDILPSNVDKGRIQIDERRVAQWKPRV
jgi:uncharacterized protein